MQLNTVALNGSIRFGAVLEQQSHSVWVSMFHSFDERRFFGERALGVDPRGVMGQQHSSKLGSRASDCTGEGRLAQRRILLIHLQNL